MAIDAAPELAVEFFGDGAGVTVARRPLAAEPWPTQRRRCDAAVRRVRCTPQPAALSRCTHDAAFSATNALVEVQEEKQPVDSVFCRS
jgi:hypothetical protein